MTFLYFFVGGFRQKFSIIRKAVQILERKKRLLGGWGKGWGKMMMLVIFLSLKLQGVYGLKVTYNFGTLNIQSAHFESSVYSRNECGEGLIWDSRRGRCDWGEVSTCIKDSF